MRAQPGFHAALEHSMRGALRLNDSEPIYHRMMSDSACMLLGMTALYLDATGGLSHQRLRDVAGISGVLSAGRVSALLMRLQMIGWVSAARDRLPGSPKLYRPTPQMIAAFQAQYRLDLESIRAMAPDMAELLTRYDRPEGFRAFMRIFGEAALRAVRGGPAEPEPILAIGIRRAGALVLIALLDAAATEAGHFPATGHARVSISALSRRFRVSRTHVLKILREAVAARFFTHGATEGEGVVQPALLEAFEQVYAVIYIGLAASAHLALGDQPAAAAAA
ncbi:MAG: hypothetical protein ABI655_13895 [Phenylobacterium sp.]